MSNLTISIFGNKILLEIINEMKLFSKYKIKYYEDFSLCEKEFKKRDHLLIYFDSSKKENIDEILTKIDTTGELYNSNKEYLSEIKSNENTVSFLIRQKEDIHGRAKYESLTEKFGISEILNIKHGVIWNVIVNSGNFESTINSILETNILFNTLSYECYRIK